MIRRILIVLSIVPILSAACAPIPKAVPTPTAAPVPGAPEDWQTYTNPLGFAIRYPSTWSQEELAEQSGATIHTVVLKGVEGSVELHWGVGFGGACPQGYTTVKVAQGELPTCYSLLADGTEVWAQINKQLETTSFSAEARTANAEPASHDLIMQILATLAFPPPEQGAGVLPTATSAVAEPAITVTPEPQPPAAAGSAMQPLDPETCALLAQDMAHALDVEVTQAEVPFTESATGATGTGCQATATGTGVQFASPDAVVNALDSMLEGHGWQEDMNLEAGGPTGIGSGYRKGNQVCLVGAIWHPDASANCPDDKPISTCKVTPEQQLYTVTLDCAQSAAGAAYPATQVITYTPGPPSSEPREGSCWTNSLAVWREEAWRCSVGNDIYDPCFAESGKVICGASPVTTTVSFVLSLTEPLPAPEVPPDTAGHAWLVELADGMVCEFATGATGGVGDERINYFCPSPNADQSVVILGDLKPGAVYMAHRAVLTGNMPDLTVQESAEVPIRTVWR